MKIEKDKVVNLVYKMYITNEDGQEELWEETPKNHPLTYCHGEGMMLASFESALVGKAAGDAFDFRIGKADAYGEYDDEGVLTLDKKLFHNGDGEFDDERVVEGNIIPMNTQDGQIVNAQVVEVGEKTVTIDLNHPLAGEDLHFVGTIVSIRDVDPQELEAIRHPHKCGRCHGHCENGQEGGCQGGNCDKQEGQSCGGNCHCGQ